MFPDLHQLYQMLFSSPLQIFAAQMKVLNFVSGFRPLSLLFSLSIIILALELHISVLGQIYSFFSHSDMEFQFIQICETSMHVQYKFFFLLHSLPQSSLHRLLPVTLH